MLQPQNYGRVVRFHQHSIYFVLGRPLVYRRNLTGANQQVFSSFQPLLPLSPKLLMFGGIMSVEEKISPTEKTADCEPT